MELWATEDQTPSLRFSCKITETLKVEQTDFQHLAVVNTEQFGKMLLLDGMVMITDTDEFVYHEMITNVALNSHPSPRKVLIIGGGDGGTLREAVRHPLVDTAVLVEIDEKVITAAKKFFPKLSCSFNDPKAQVVVADGIKYVQSRKEEFDIIIVDSTEPVGPAVELFFADFYRDCFNALNDEGMLVVQSESPFFNAGVIQMAFGGVNRIFALTKLYLASVPTYPSGLWSFTIGSKKYDPAIPLNKNQGGLKYYNADVHQAAFKLPGFVENIIARK